MEDLLTQIISNKPNLTDNSLRAYLANLKRIYKATTNESIDKISVEYFIKHKEHVLKYLNELKPAIRKTLLASLVVLLEPSLDADDYRKAMLQDIETYNKEIDKNQKDDTQNKNWITLEEIQKIHKQLGKEANALYKKPNKSIDDFLKIQDYIIVSLLGGIYIAPRRLLDYTEFKIKNIDLTKDNYLDIKGKQLVFNTYKTAKSYGEQRVDIPKTVLAILKKWIKVNPTDYLLFDTKQTKLNNVQLTQYLNRIFNKNISVNILRHVYITENMPKELDSLDTLKTRASGMGHSMTTHLTYVKH